MTAPPLRARARIGSATLALALALSGGTFAVAAGVPATQAPLDDLDQVIDPNQQQGAGRVVLTAGHVDFGATFGTGSWALQLHDDTSVPRYWRDPEDVVLKVTDAAILQVPDSEAFAFLQLPHGSPVHVVPQVEQPGVIWVGWNTQEPTLLDSLNLGATLRLHAIEGPGDVVVYLQSGNFGDPQQLWSTHDSFPQDAWIEVNTHTHANWVFSEPGVYLVDAEFAAELITGEEMSARGVLRFAVGDATDPEAAFAAVLSRSATGETEKTMQDDTDTPDERTADQPEAPAGAEGLTWIVVGIGAAALVAAVGAVSVTSARARRRARAGGGASGAGGEHPR